MRILCQTGPYRASWKKVFDAAGHRCEIWDPQQKPAFDAFDEADPHLFIAASPPSRAVSKQIASRSPKGMAMIMVGDLQALPAADSFLYDAGISRKELECDFCYVGAYRPDKEAILNSYVLPLAERGGTLKILGSGPWPSPDFLGSADEETVQCLYRSARVCLNVAASGRTSERIFNIMLAGGICVTNELRDSPIPGDLAVRGLKPEDFHMFACELLLSKLTEWRRHMQRRSLRFIFNGHTYWHRCDGLLRRSGFDLEADRLIEVYKKCYCPSMIV